MYDGVEIRGSASQVCSYGSHWGSVSSLYVVENFLYVVMSTGIDAVSLSAEGEVRNVIDRVRDDISPSQVRARVQCCIHGYNTSQDLPVPSYIKCD